jgi:2-polyprenyl-6-methoxyphenol hydroxylase-like FAD-dependent oxidoreductase
MRHTDIAIIGGGLAGSAAAAMLGRAGFPVLVIDPNAVSPPDFRCEKLDGSQVRVLCKTGLADVVLRAATPIDQLWVARYGRLLQKRGNDQFGIFYDALVNVIRGEIAPGAQFVLGKVSAIQTSPDRQTVTLSDGDEISARLIVLATGLNNALRRTLGIERHDVSPCHSVSIGFDLRPVGARPFDFPALTYYPERAADMIAYLTLFPIGDMIRANLFVYHDSRDPWLRTFRDAPHATLYAAMPGLRRLMPDFQLMSDVKIRPVDLFITTGYRQPGVVIVGDAFASSCPAAGTGANKVFTDVERLCNVYIPRWLATEGMGKEKIGAFYDDPIKLATDTHSAEKARYLRSLSIDSALSWRMRRLGKFVGGFGMGIIRGFKERASQRPPRPTAESARP